MFFLNKTPPHLHYAGIDDVRVSSTMAKVTAISHFVASVKAAAAGMGHCQVVQGYHNVEMYKGPTTLSSGCEGEMNQFAFISAYCVGFFHNYLFLLKTDYILNNLRAEREGTGKHDTATAR